MLLKDKAINQVFKEIFRIFNRYLFNGTPPGSVRTNIFSGTFELSELQSFESIFAGPYLYLVKYSY